jgi:LmbE family N-acetylglucosaminyl deacetylase
VKPAHPLLGRRLLLITAHPDDEAYFASGTAAANFGRGGQTAIICASLGEKGTAHLKRPTTASQLKRRRRRELLAATRVARIRPVHVFHYPDGRVQDSAEAYRRHCLRIARRWRPDAVLTFGFDGMTGHRDHIAAGRVGRAVGLALGRPVYVFTFPVRLGRRAAVWFLKRRVNPHYAALLPYPRPTLRLTVDPKRKFRSIGQYKSQLDAGGPLSQLPADVRRTILGNEYFARVRLSKRFKV